MSNRILVLVDSMSALERPWVRVASIDARCFLMRFAKCTNGLILERCAHLIQSFNAWIASVPRSWNTSRKLFL